MSIQITEEYFKKALGFAPENDDLDRCNCGQAGQLGHDGCGWHPHRNKPNFMVPADDRMY